MLWSLALAGGSEVLTLPSWDSLEYDNFSLLVQPRLAPLSQLPRVLLRYPAGAPLPGQGEVTHIRCLLGTTFPLRAAARHRDRARQGQQ